MLWGQKGNGIEKISAKRKEMATKEMEKKDSGKGGDGVQRQKKKEGE